ncbi:MAG: hypothetical protein HC868_07345, partial [Sphingomonadales bacterium]|nr:hypothetical protein [Sphingomonadales bacterium]
RRRRPGHVNYEWAGVAAICGDGRRVGSWSAACSSCWCATIRRAMRMLRAMWKACARPSAGSWEILRLPGLLRVLGLQTVAYAVMATIMGCGRPVSA